VINMPQTARMIFIFLLVAVILIFMLPVTLGVFHIGMLYPSAICAVLLVPLIFHDWFISVYNSRFKFICILLAAAISTAVVLIAVAIGFMISAAEKAPPAKGATTVVVLGCQVRGDTPSLMLYDRMNAALNYLKQNPDSKVIASGGKGSGENISEAQAIFDFLVSRGIEKDRIYIEDKSTSTYENINYSAKIIKEKKLPASVVIASDNFHQLRAHIFAKKEGLKAYSCGNNTYFLVAPSYWAREVLAVAKAVVFGN
jgi:uncharacterized SAM-binding protein YcdF (DUF218 family)